MMDESRNHEPEGESEERSDVLDRATGILIVIVTIIVALMLITSACRAYGERSQVISEYNKLAPRIEAMEMRVERDTIEVLKRLDPDYRSAEYKRERGKLSSGEELLPIYGDEDKG
jgi:hypothetical protein